MGFEALDYISVHKKSSSNFVQPREEPKALHEPGVVSFVNGGRFHFEFLLCFLPANSPAVWLCIDSAPPGI